MKPYLYAFAICVLAGLLAACTGDGRIRITEHICYGNGDSLVRVQELQCLQYDSVMFSDGSYATYRLQYAPQNSLYEFIDREGRTVATIAQASECFVQVIVYGYDGSGRLSHLLTFYDDDEGLSRDWFGNSETFDFEVFRNKVDSVDFATPDTARYEYTAIEYNEAGEAVKASHLNTGRVIEAPDGYVLDVSVDKCIIFWASDLIGGHYIFKVCVRPQDAHARDYTLFRYADFRPTIEWNYKEGVRVRAVVYPNSSYDGCRKTTKTFATQGGNSIYTQFSEGAADTLKTIWRNRHLMCKQNISQFGTLLEQYTYQYALPSSQVKVIHEKLDYGSMKMRKVSESFTTVSKLGREEDEMMLMDDCLFYWDNVYSEDEL